MAAIRFRIAAVDCFERPVTLRLPFRFGAATVDEAPQAFVRVQLIAGDGTLAHGWSAELMIPKWFDKDPSRSHARNVDDLRASLAAAATAYVADASPASAFGHASRQYRALLAAGAREGRNALTSSYGPALVDRAVLDALGHLASMPFSALVRTNAVGLDAALTPDLGAVDLGAFVATLAPQASIAARHTVGLLDPLVDALDPRVEPKRAPEVHDRLPVSLEAVIAAYGHRDFKLKLCGRVDEDIARLARIAAVLDRLPEYRVTLDGNEQFAHAGDVRELLSRLCSEPQLGRLASTLAYLEQPLHRDVTLDTDVREAARTLPLLIDEADGTLDAFPRARAHGYAGVSSKSCKGLYKSLLNAARVAHWNGRGDEPRAFLSGEDLTCQAGLSVQQDLALVGLLGLRDVERNGHHYVDGFAGQHAGAAERGAFLAAHPDLYRADGDNVRLRITGGRIGLGSLGGDGFASGAQPDAATLAPLGTPKLAPAASHRTVNPA